MGPDLQQEWLINIFIHIKGRPSQSNSYQLEDLMTSNLDEWLVDWNGEDNSCPGPVEELNSVKVYEPLRGRYYKIDILIQVHSAQS